MFTDGDQQTMANIGLYRSRQRNIVAGVMSGIAERYGWNANLLRIIFVIVSLISAAFPGIIVYIVLWLIMPKAPLNSSANLPQFRNLN